MTNIFDPSRWPMCPPETFVSGDYFAFKRDDLSVSFPLSSYAIKFCTSQFGSGTGTTSSSQISLDAVESGSEYQITAGATTTSSWAVWKYQWALFVNDSADAQKRQIVDNGVFEIKPNWVSSTVDPRSSGTDRGHSLQPNSGWCKFLLHRRTEPVKDGTRWTDWIEGLLCETSVDGKAEWTPPSEEGNWCKHFSGL